jgi:2-polyprenyl-3-methyl-5-hydroxy-6-metoxy-1,4-benzoquinol methylase
MDHNVTAVYPFKHPNPLKEINYYTNIFNNKLLPNNYDLIISSHSLGHVNNLQNVQFKFYYLLKNLVFLFIDVPNRSS